MCSRCIIKMTVILHCFYFVVEAVLWRRCFQSKCNSCWSWKLGTQGDHNTTQPLRQDLLSPRQKVHFFSAFLDANKTKPKVIPVSPYWSVTSCLFYRASVSQFVALPACFPRLTSNFCFPALVTGFLFSPVFPRLRSDSCFPALRSLETLVIVFPEPRIGL